MITVRLYKWFKKKTNSTKRPDSSITYTDYSCEVRSPSSLINPVVEISSSSNILAQGYTYANIAAFHGSAGGKYYYVDDIVYDRGLWVVYLKIDVLATYRGYISSTNLYILRASSNIDGSLTDTYFPATSEISTTDIFFDEPASVSYGSSGRYVLNVIGKGNTPGITSYQLTPAQMQNLMTALYTTADGYDWGDFTQGFWNSLFNPEEKIVSCFWFPKPLLTSGSGTVSMGLWDSGVSAAKLDQSSPGTHSYQVNIPRHPQASSLGQYCNLKPYSEYVLDMGFLPLIQLDNSKLLNDPTILIQIYPDPLTGLAEVKGITYNTSPSAPNEQELFKLTAPYGVPINLSSQKNNLAGAITGVGAMVAGLATESVGLGAAVGIMSESAKQLEGTITNSGTIGNIGGHRLDKVLYCRFRTIAERDIANIGGPCCKVLQPQNINGYMVAAQGLFECDIATKSEIDMVNNFMTTGFYYE